MTPHERILVVDDEEQMRDLLVKVLERKGYQVSVCGNGADALAFLEREPVDLVVTDVRMPGLSGMEALRAIKELNGRRFLHNSPGVHDSHLLGDLGDHPEIVSDEQYGCV